MITITTHILDTSSGLPAANIDVTLEFQTADNQWQEISNGTTNNDGRIPGLVPESKILGPGYYRLTFETAAYFQKKNIPSFYPYVQVVFELTDIRHYHIPLLLSPYGYSTYRGS